MDLPYLKIIQYHYNNKPYKIAVIYFQNTHKGYSIDFDLLDQFNNLLPDSHNFAINNAHIKNDIINIIIKNMSL